MGDVEKSPWITKCFFIPSIQLIYGQNKEPTSGLEPLTPAHYE
jgi:hypothetical protein